VRYERGDSRTRPQHLGHVVSRPIRFVSVLVFVAGLPFRGESSRCSIRIRIDRRSAKLSEKARLHHAKRTVVVVSEEIDASVLCSPGAGVPGGFGRD